MADWSEFTIARKKNLKVHRSGKEGKGTAIRAVLTILPRKRQPQWRGLHLDLEHNRAEWKSFRSQASADAWAKFGMDLNDLG